MFKIFKKYKFIKIVIIFILAISEFSALYTCQPAFATFFEFKDPILVAALFTLIFIFFCNILLCSVTFLDD